MLLLESGASAPMQYPLTLTLSDKAKALYEDLRSVADKVSDSRGYCAAVSQVHFFCPGEIVADALCMARSTLYLKIAELKAADLIDARAHYVTHRGRTRADGMVWAIKMNPERQGAVKVPYDVLKKSYRCLSADIEAGRTAWATIGQSKKTSREQDIIKEILSWALPPYTTQNPVKGLTVRCDLEQVLDVPHVDKQERAIAVDGAARAIALSLGDAGGLMFWRWLLWRLTRLQEAGIEAPWHQVYEQVRRARSERAEGYGRNSAALVVSRLKQAPWWDELQRLPASRVRTKPAEA